MRCGFDQLSVGLSTRRHFAAFGHNATEEFIGLNIVDSSGTWLVINDEVQPNFERRAYPQDQYSSSDVVVTLLWSWNYLPLNASASLNATYKVFLLPDQDSADILDSAQLSLPSHGAVPHELSPFNVTFHCSAVGETAISS